MTNVVWNAFIGQMMSRCFLRSYADGDNGYRTEIKEGKASERQKVAARAAWLGGCSGRWDWTGKLSCSGMQKDVRRIGGTFPPHMSDVEVCCCFRHTHTFLCSFSLPFMWTFRKHLSRNTSCISDKYFLDLLLIEIPLFSLSRYKETPKIQREGTDFISMSKNKKWTWSWPENG